MRHNVFGKKLSRTKNERKRLFANLIRDIILHGKIVTSRAKAKAVQPLIEKLITKAKKGSDVHRRRILKIIPYGAIVDSLMSDAKDRFAGRSSGYTRIIKIGNVRSDGSEEVMLSFVDAEVVREPVKYEKEAKKTPSDKVTKEKTGNKRGVKKIKKSVRSVKK